MKWWFDASIIWYNSDILNRKRKYPHSNNFFWNFKIEYSEYWIFEYFGNSEMILNIKYKTDPLS